MSSITAQSPVIVRIQQIDLGLLYVLCIPAGAALAGLDGVQIGGANYTGPLWLMYLAAGLLVLLAAKIHLPRRRIAFPCLPWLAWFGFVWLSIAWTRSPLGRGIQDALQISMPLVVGAAASLFIRNEFQLKQLFHAFGLALAMIAVLICAQVSGLLSSAGVTCQVRALALTLVLIGCVFIAQSPERRLFPLLGWGACVLLTVISGSRMATGALLLIPILHPLYRNLLGKATILIILAIIGIAVFNTDTFQRRFFYTGRGTITDVWQGRFLSFGRFEAWPKIWTEAWREPVLGHGVGSVNEFVPRVWPGMNHAHNDYLRVGFELGIAGLVLFLLILTWQAVALRRRLWRSSGAIRAGCAAALLGLLMFMITACTDNPLIYNLWYMNPLFALIGAVYGASQSAGDKLLLQANHF